MKYVTGFPLSNESLSYDVCKAVCKVGLGHINPSYFAFHSSSMEWKMAAAEKLAGLEAEEEDQFLTLLPASQQPIA